jgi:hypothetical protein
MHQQHPDQADRPADGGIGQYVGADIVFAGLDDAEIAATGASATAEIREGICKSRQPNLPSKPEIVMPASPACGKSLEAAMASI